MAAGDRKGVEDSRTWLEPVGGAHFAKTINRLHLTEAAFARLEYIDLIYYGFHEKRLRTQLFEIVVAVRERLAKKFADADRHMDAVAAAREADLAASDSTIGSASGSQLSVGLQDEDEPSTAAGSGVPPGEGGSCDDLSSTMPEAPPLPCLLHRDSEADLHETRFKLAEAAFGGVLPDVSNLTMREAQALGLNVVELVNDNWQDGIAVAPFCAVEVGEISLYLGQKVEANFVEVEKGKEEDWLEVRVVNRDCGWVPRAYVLPPEDAATFFEEKNIPIHLQSLPKEGEPARVRTFADVEREELALTNSGMDVTGEAAQASDDSTPSTPRTKSKKKRKNKHGSGSKSRKSAGMGDSGSDIASETGTCGKRQSKQTPRHAPTNVSGSELCIALYDCVADHEDELTFEAYVTCCCCCCCIYFVLCRRVKVLRLSGR